MVSLAPIEMVIFWGMVNMALFYPHEFKFSWIQPARHAKSSVSRFGFAGLWAGPPEAKVLEMAEIPGECCENIGFSITGTSWGHVTRITMVYLYTI